MAKENIFDLSKVSTPSYDYETPALTERDMESQLDGYNLIPQQDWKKIQAGALIRYLRKDGAFRRGGTVEGVWEIKDKNNIDAIKIDILSSYGGKAWSITSNSVEKIWTKNNQAVRSTSNVYELKEDIETCKESIKQLVIQVQTISNQQIRIVNFIKKLHKLK